MHSAHLPLQLRETLMTEAPPTRRLSRGRPALALEHGACNHDSSDPRLIANILDLPCQNPLVTRDWPRP